MAMFKTGRLSLTLGSFFAGMMVSRGLAQDTDIILGPSYKGSAIAQSTAIALWQEFGIDLVFDYDRKEAKTHGEGSVSKSTFVNKAFFDGCRIFIVDDVATSMGTKYELLEKIDSEAQIRGRRFQIKGVGIGIDREQTGAVYDREGNVTLGSKGENAIASFENRSGIPVYAVAGITEVVTHLHREKIPVLIRGKREPIDEKTKAEFDEYLRVYGVDRKTAI
jgi:orotate phosphoribosyltransferase